ncbi:hypothetical protein [Pseudoruegeria sp. HB172150]|uniref:hypothetical protein n=1 Tax=Pseudoruegeria sp. HB172150 TaxID=2721164 RepID=UPI001552B0AB|nr:hypothetical protein [Pseudoruegeria sp. HB172150]
MFHSTDNAGETIRKLQVLSDWYAENVDTSTLTPSLRCAHRHMFGLTAFDVSTPVVQSLARSRSGLEATESMLRYLKASPETVEVFSEKSMTRLLENTEPLSGWAKHFWSDWLELSDEGAPGMWWPVPVLNHLLANHFPASTLRSVTIALEAMGVVERRRARHQVNPKSRANAIRVTKRGLMLDEELRK